MRGSALLTVGRAYAASRWRMRRLRDRATINRHQATQLVALTRDAARDLPFYRACGGQPFDRWPVIDKAVLLGHFAALNRPGLSADDVRGALARGEERLAEHLIGMSTGTSGNRGLYVITEAERFVWLGTILAKALPDALWRRHRVALALPTVSDLYRAATVASRVELRFFDLAHGPQAWADALDAFAPDTIVATPQVLRWLAERGRLTMERIFSTAEVLDPADRELVERTIGRRVRQIYMATEGLLGVSCAFGTLHLAEDVVHFGYERPDPASPLVTPVVTDFTRRAQAMIHYRMNDLIELDSKPCPCGSALQAVRRIEGRVDDAFLLADLGGREQLVTPDVLRNAVIDADPAIQDFRLVQVGPQTITVTLDATVSDAAAAKVVGAVRAVLSRRGLAPDLSLKRGIAPDYGRKLRRVSRTWRAPAPPA